MHGLKLTWYIMTVDPYLVAVDAHCGEEKRGGGKGDDLSVDDQFTAGRTKHPLTECDEQYLGGHRDDADEQVTDGQVDEEDADTSTTQRRVARDAADERHVSGQRRRHYDEDRRHANHDVRRPHAAVVQHRRHRRPRDVAAADVRRRRDVIH